MEAPARDEELLARVGEDGDEAALVTLMGRHKQALFAFVYRYLGNESDSAEVAEATFLKVYTNAHRFKASATVKTWMFSIARNLARDRLRKRKKARSMVSLEQENNETAPPPLAYLASDTPTPSGEALSRESLTLLEREVAALPEKLRFPFVFCVLEEHSYDECAAVLKTNRKAVETRIYRARQRLKERLTPRVGA
jgi:RNA polymerase sigma-70 factor (ECF subfamily)